MCVFICVYPQLVYNSNYDLCYFITTYVHSYNITNLPHLAIHTYVVEMQQYIDISPYRDTLSQ